MEQRLKDEMVNEILEEERRDRAFRNALADRQNLVPQSFAECYAQWLINMEKEYEDATDSDESDAESSDDEITEIYVMKDGKIQTIPVDKL